MSKITNTASASSESKFMNALGGIENQESRGQQELVTSCQLPVKGKEKLEKMGVQFGEPNEDDPLFCEAKLPAGWSKRPTDHSMWSEVIDDQNNVKAMIFYKAAFYDRDAFIS